MPSNSTSMTWREAHGHKGEAHWPLPRLAATSQEPGRSDQGNTILANEYLDAPDVLTAKVERLADLVRRSLACVAYTGAGLSKTSGIPDYATRAANSVVGRVPKLRSSLDALPTLAHHVLTAMERAGLLMHQVQQNHDGLPQKAGFPQEKINEIHGAWFDPSNPVVSFGGSLRGDLFDWMLEMERRADLCLCLGTSLSGMNADRMATTPSRRFLEGQVGALGTVIVNLQRTRLDGGSTLRIWAPLDEVFSRLALTLGLEVDTTLYSERSAHEVHTLPYDAEGRLEPRRRMRLDLRKGQQVRVVAPGASTFGQVYEVVGRRPDGHYVLAGGGRRCVLGSWWLDAAREGRIEQLPLTNISPAIEVLPELPDALHIVQTHSLGGPSEGNRHLWRVSLGGAEQLVERVEWHLHPTFTPNVVHVEDAPFSLTRRGWGTFDLRARLILAPHVAEQLGRASICAVHTLDFSREGERAGVTRVPLQGSGT